MINYIKRGDFWNADAAIIYNPVSISNRFKIFDGNIKHQYPKVYESYIDFMIGVPWYKLIGDIQLIQIDDTRCIMNAFVYDQGKLDLKAVAKTFVECSNLAEEYEISISLSSNLGISNKNIEIIKLIDKTINVAFSDCKSDVFVYLGKK